MSGARALGDLWDHWDLVMTACQAAGRRKGERTGYVLKLTPFWWASGVQDIPDKDVETEETDCDEKDDERGEQQERPGRRYDPDDSGDGD
jgi:hypothetical protein